MSSLAAAETPRKYGMPTFGTDPQLETYSIECSDTADVIPRLTTLFWRHSVELQNLSTWKSIRSGGSQGMVVTSRRPAALTDEALVKRINHLVGVVKVRRETFEESLKFKDLTVEVSATGYYVDKLATLGYEFNATPLRYSMKCIVMQLFDSGKRIDEFLTRLSKHIDPRMTGEVRVASSQRPALVLLSRKALGG
ncbi:hypothetical protein [Rhodococcus sp. JS3073]|uniref:hypothetical protein n=1 Tax=Rhodococcus sp. JS3073 TaxID=3002901 RepID=UPI002285D608|nr:hypothetical protein [Rhodococcus sp. JS3073]WAM19211.1 hypothetical protein OYT95_42565 [Rhodococcus sp. JS3073]